MNYSLSHFQTDDKKINNLFKMSVKWKKQWVLPIVCANTYWLNIKSTRRCTQAHIVVWKRETNMKRGLFDNQIREIFCAMMMPLKYLCNDDKLTYYYTTVAHVILNSFPPRMKCRFCVCCIEDAIFSQCVSNKQCHSIAADLTTTPCEK